MSYTQHFNNKGFTLLESLIAFVILTIGLLGAIGLQAKAKQASYDSLQRAAALTLANDVIHRMRANDTADLLNAYKVEVASTDPAVNVKSCLNNSCSSTEMAAFDVEEWKKQIKAKEFTGALADARLCITPSSTAKNEINLEVVVSWQGRQSIKQSSDNKKIVCGINTKNRRLLTLNSFILLRS